eukprot:2096883-Prymnesium_polylepis.2
MESSVSTALDGAGGGGGGGGGGDSCHGHLMCTIVLRFAREVVMNAGLKSLLLKSLLWLYCGWPLDVQPHQAGVCERGSVSPAQIGWRRAGEGDGLKAKSREDRWRWRRMPACWICHCSWPQEWRYEIHISISMCGRIASGRPQ